MIDLPHPEPFKLEFLFDNTIARGDEIGVIIEGHLVAGLLTSCNPMGYHYDFTLEYMGEVHHFTTGQAMDRFLCMNPSGRPFWEE